MAENGHRFHQEEGEQINRGGTLVGDEDLRRLLEKVDAEVRKHDPARGKWSVRGDKARATGYWRCS